MKIMKIKDFHNFEDENYEIMHVCPREFHNFYENYENYGFFIILDPKIMKIMKIMNLCLPGNP